MTDASAVFSCINRDLSALGGQVGLDKHKLKENEAIIKSFKDDYSQVLFRIHALEQSKKDQAERIKTLEMGMAFVESNSQADAMRIQRLEEQFDDLLNAVGQTQDKLCTCKINKVRVFLL